MEQNQNTDQQSMTLEEVVANAMRQLPQPVREFLAGPERGRVTLALTQKHRLHVDQAATFERSFIHMLLGIASPEEFLSELRNAGVDENTSKALINDVNTQVFKPLREREQMSMSAASVVSADRAPAPEIPANLPTGNPPFPAPAAQVPPPQPSYTEPPVMPQHSMPQPYPQYQMPQMQHSTYWVPVSIAHPPQMPGYPYPPQNFAPPIPPPQPTTPIPTPPSPAEITAPTQPQTPQETPPAPAPSQSLPPHPSTPIVKQYGSDPYREPIQ